MVCSISGFTYFFCPCTYICLLFLQNEGNKSGTKTALLLEQEQVARSPNNNRSRGRGESNVQENNIKTETKLLLLESSSSLYEEPALILEEKDENVLDHCVKQFCGPDEQMLPPAPPTTLNISSYEDNSKLVLLLSPLRERLSAIESITESLQSSKTKEKNEYDTVVSDLADQVSSAVAIQKEMKSEVEKLEQRVADLENHNKAMATMIIPTIVSFWCILLVEYAY